MRHFVKSEARYPGLWKGCVGAWAPLLGPTASMLRDHSGFMRHGSMISTMSPATGWEVSGGKWSLLFDGSDDYIDNLGNVSDYSFIQNTLQFTIAFWIRLSSTTLRMFPLGSTLTSTEKGLFISIEYGAGDGTNAVRCFIAKGTGGVPVIDNRTADGTLATTEWTHIAVTGVGTGIAIIINGVSQALTTISAFSSLSSGDSSRIFHAGRANYSSTVSPMSGNLDDIRIYRRALSGGEIALLARRRGIAYETAHRRSYKAAAAVGNRRRRVLIGAG